jgi:hypothetical protein
VRALRRTDDDLVLSDDARIGHQDGWETWVPLGETAG